MNAESPGIFSPCTCRPWPQLDILQYKGLVHFLLFCFETHPHGKIHQINTEAFPPALRFRCPEQGDTTPFFTLPAFSSFSKEENGSGLFLHTSYYFPPDYLKSSAAALDLSVQDNIFLQIHPNPYLLLRHNFLLTTDIILINSTISTS